jgi:murein DD-endopeptidase MepM/ murein hydrolase activator NlpD
MSSVDAAGQRLASYELVVPVAGVIRRELRDTYSEHRGGRLHEALDIHAPRGSPVVAVGDGRVAKLFKSVEGGLTVYQFDPSEQFAYYYAHLDRYDDRLTEGMVLRRGDPIGVVGTTGNAPADAPHLHFAIFRLGPEKQWWKGTPINPYQFLN